MTFTASVRWIVEVFPWSSGYPTPGSNDDVTSLTLDLEDNGGSPVVFASDATALGINSAIDAAKKSAGQKSSMQDTQRLSTGLKSVSYNRNKLSPEVDCTFTLIGPVNKSIVKGTWVLITSLSNEASVKKLIRFVGQIAHVSPSYAIVGDDGNIIQQTAVRCKEWSRALTIPINYDIGTISAALNKTSTGLGQFLQNATTLAGSAGILDPKKHAEIMSQAYKPYEFAHLFLTLAGAINSTDQVDAIATLIGQKAQSISSIGLAMPSVPKALLARLGIDATPRQAFSKGFVKVITGTSTQAANVPDKWNGVFGDKGADSLDTYAATFNDSPKGRPISTGMGVLAALNDSVWGAITKYTDPSNNEVFTDIYYELNDNNEYVAQPVIIIRDKPFLLEYQAEQNYYKSRISSAEWSLYDDLPRFYMPAGYITNIAFDDTYENSANYFRMVNLDNLADPVYNTLDSQRYRQKRDNEMRRYGGSEMAAQTNFYGVDIKLGDNSGFSLDKWFQSLTAITEAWHGESYKMPSGRMSIKDNNFPISVGHNLRFDIGPVSYVCHIEQVASAFTVEDNGTEVTQTEIVFSRLVQVDVDGTLIFLGSGQVNDLFNRGKK